MSNKSFVHLHSHANASMLDGLAQISKLVPAVEELGMPAIALTDHGSMAATYDLYKATKDSPVKPIYGIEAYVSPAVPRTLKEPVKWNQGGEDDVSGAGAYTHMTLLAETDEGLTNLFQISSEAYLTGFYKKPRTDEELFQTFGKGIIATTGCPSGEVQTWLRIGDYQKAKEAAAKFADIFGKENFFVELMDHGLDIERRVIKQLIQIAKELGLQTVATNDLHYVHQSDSHAHDALLCIGSGSKLADEKRFRFDAQDFYLKTAAEMRHIWDDVDGAEKACDNTLLIAERANATFQHGEDLMPKFPVPEGETEATWLRKEVEKGFQKRYGNNIPQEYRERAEYELGIIERMKFPGYFLVVADYINWAKEQGIRVGPARGCLSGDSNVLTPNGVINIKDIKVGTEVYNQHGEIVEVPAVFKYECDEDLVEIKAFYGVNGNKMTADHKVLVSKPNHKTKLITAPIWTEAREVEKGDYVVMPKNLNTQEEPLKDNHTFTIEDEHYVYYEVYETNLVPSEGYVYDFTVPGTNSYVTDSYVVHNSGGGSFVCYLINITDIDPMQHGLLFERFLNPERVSMPDLDIDFDDRRRGEVIEYVKQKYGEDKVANIATFSTIKAKAAFKDSLRVLGAPYMLGDKLSKAYPPPIVGRDLALADAYDPSHERYDEAAEFRALVEADPEAQKAIELALSLEGVKRGFGMHAAGVIMSARPIVETVPLMKRDTNSPTMTQFEYPTCEYLGLIKMDFLGLSNLGTIDECLKLIKANRGVDVDLDKIGRDLDDKKTFELLAEGNTIGVFQLDSPPMRALLKLMAPDQFDDISAVLALYRPGPMAMNAHNDYADRKNKRKPVIPIHRELTEPLAPILDETFGIICYQEQVMAIAQKVAGYSLGQADLLRRAMGKKSKEVLDKEYIPFSTGMKENGYSEEAIQTLWEILLPFSDYAFNKCVSDRTMIRNARNEPVSAREIYNAHLRGEEVWLQAMWPDGEIRPHKVDKVVMTGMKPLFRVKTADNRTVDATADHRLLTTRGYIKVEDMIVGSDELIVGDKISDIPVQRVYKSNGSKVSNSVITVLDSTGKFVASNGMMCDSLNELRMAEFLIENNIEFEMHKLVGKGECDFYFEGVYWEMDGMDRHISYFERKYGDIPFVVVTPEDYMERISTILDLDHARNGDVIVSIEPVRTRSTIDIEMAEDGPKNYLTWKGIVSHNSHSAGYGLISYWTAYLKANFPTEYMAALLTTNADNKDKLALYLGECRRMGVEVLPPDVNASELNYTAVGDDVRVGLIGIKGVGEAGVQLWLQERREHGPAKSFGDFLERADASISAKGKVDALISGGAFDCFGVPRSAMHFVHEAACEQVRKLKKAKPKNDTVISLFDAFEGDDDFKGLGLVVEFPDIAEWDKKEKLARERAVLGLYVSDHPLSEWRDALELLSTHSIAYLRDAENLPDEQVKIAGLVVSVDRRLTKKAAEPWAIVTVEDLDSSMQVLVFPKTYADVSDFLVPDAVLVFSGRVEKKDDGSTSFAVRDVSAPDMAAAQRKAERAKAKALEAGQVDAEGEPVVDKAKVLGVAAGHQDDGNTSPVVVSVDEKQLTAAMTEKFKELMVDFAGSRPVQIRMLREDGHVVTFALGDEYKVVGSGQFAAEVRALFGPDAV